ncbi:hypothetical protein ELP56_28910, partial [Klebsiella pneumoniae]|nr:hypothetical protein [Klebsiella pneumoniae]
LHSTSRRQRQMCIRDSSKTIKGTVDSIAAGVTNASSSSDSKGMASVDSNLEWVRLAQRVPVRILSLIHI